ncbi:MAG: manganese efflux pump [Deltaproteobacteria bacterium]|nr:manganese efflux pump [Deltaproteobacteria bacterium]
MIDVIIMAVALSMDAFAVSIGLGAKHAHKNVSLALMSGLYFGLFQGIMPLIGFMCGKSILPWVYVYAPWVAFFLLLLIGGKMIYESLFGGIEENIAKITHKAMLFLAVATSIDAMAAGFTLSLISVNIIISSIIIGTTTFFFSLAGVFIGSKSGTWLEGKAELFGGVILILVGVKILLL